MLDDDEYDEDYFDDDDDSSETIACPECGADIYEDAEQCPLCGCYITASHHTSIHPGWRWVAVILAVLFFLASGGIALFSC